MNSHFTNKYTIGNHPIKDFPDRIRDKYLKGLGSVLYQVSNGQADMKLIFSRWCKSIVGDGKDQFFVSDKSAIKKAVSLCLYKFRLFRLKKEFLFDCFYLTETFNSACLSKLSVLLEQVGMTYKNIESDSGVPSSLIEHRNLNRSYQNQLMKKVLVVATMSAGKSTLINALTGYPLNRTKTTACTNKLCYIINNKFEDGIIYQSGNGGLQFNDNIESVNSDNFDIASLRFDSTLSDSKICLIDSPGINYAMDKTHGQITTNAIKANDYDALIYVSNCQYFGTTDERDILELIVKYCKKPKIFVINKLDSFKKKEDSISQVLSYYKSDLAKMGERNATIVPMSAYPAFLSKRDLNKRNDEDDDDEYQRFQKRMADSNYDLPSYVTNYKSNTLVEKSGILLLENTIFNITQ